MEIEAVLAELGTEISKLKSKLEKIENLVQEIKVAYGKLNNPVHNTYEKEKVKLRKNR